MKKYLLSHLRAHPIATLAVSGLATGAIFAWQLPYYALPVLLLPLYWFVIFTPKPLGLAKSLAFQISFFAPFYFVILSWFLDADIAAIAGLSNNIAVLTSFLWLLVMTLLITIATLPLMLFLGKLSTQERKNTLVVICLVAAAWVVTEWFRSMVFGAFLYGHGATIGDFWNFGSFGLAMIQSPLAYLSRFVGMYGLTFLVVSVSGLLYIALVKKSYRPGLIVVIAALLLSGVGYVAYDETPNASYQASVLQIQRNPPNGVSEVPINNQSQTPKSFVVLPEYSYTYEPGMTAFAEKYVNQRLANDGFSVGVSNGRQAEKYGTLEFRDNAGKLITSHTKELLIPTGEYLPFVFVGFFKLTGQPEVIENFNSLRRLNKGQPGTTFQQSNIKLGPVACSGILGRGIYRELARDGADILTNSASLLSLNGSRAYFRQSIQMAKFHAIANNRPFIQATKGAPAFVLNKDGDFVVKPGDSTTKFIDFTVSPTSKKTVYAYSSEWTLLISAFILMTLLLRLIQAKYGKNVAKL